MIIISVQRFFVESLAKQKDLLDVKCGYCVIESSCLTKSSEVYVTDRGCLGQVRKIGRQKSMGVLDIYGFEIFEVSAATSPLRFPPANLLLNVTVVIFHVTIPKIRPFLRMDVSCPATILVSVKLLDPSKSFSIKSLPFFPLPV